MEIAVKANREDQLLSQVSYVASWTPAMIYVEPVRWVSVSVRQPIGA
jgi:hypothetical protein